MSQIIQIAGSLMILSGFALAQWGVLNPKSFVYLVLNTVGAAVLAANAYLEQQWGFLLLEGVWSVVSAIALIQILRRPGGVGQNGPHASTEDGDHASERRGSSARA